MVRGLSVNTFSPEALVAQQAIVSLHSWSFWTGAGKYGKPLRNPTPGWRRHGGAGPQPGQVPRKPMWLEEFGACTEEMPAADVPRWLELTTTAAVEQGVSWFTWWASHDVDRRFDFNPFEYGLG